MSEPVLVLVSCPPENAENISQTLVEEGLAACVSILKSVVSIYRFKGELCKDEESLLLIKSEGKLWVSLEQRVKELHTYEVPEILLIPIERGHPPYLSWLAETVDISGLTVEKGK